VNAASRITITPIFVADLLVEGERMPVYVHVIDHTDARVLVDTGMTELHPRAADLDRRLSPLNGQDFDVSSVDIVVNTHLHGTGSHEGLAGRLRRNGRASRHRRRRLDTVRSDARCSIRGIDSDRSDNRTIGSATWGTCVGPTAETRR
jgi:N-acyl homoserine lactone hydrolase